MNTQNNSEKQTSERPLRGKTIINVSAILLIIVGAITSFLTGIGSLGGIGHPLNAESLLFMRSELIIAILALGIGIFGKSKASKEKSAKDMIFAGIFLLTSRVIILVFNIISNGEYFYGYEEAMTYLSIFIAPIVILSLLIIWGGWRNKKSNTKS